MKKVVILMLLTAINANAMNVLISRLAPRGVVFSAIAHSSFAFGLLGNLSKELKLEIEEVDVVPMPTTGTSFAYLDTMVAGGNDAQLAETKKKERKDLHAFVKIVSPHFSVPGSREKEAKDVSSEAKAGDEPASQPILYVVIRKNITAREPVIARLAGQLGNALQKKAFSILSLYEDKNGDVISLASKFPFMVLTARNQAQLSELEKNLACKNYVFVKEEGAIAYLNIDGDRSVNGNCSLAK